MADNVVNIASLEDERKSIRKKKSERSGVENAWDVKVPKFQKGDMKHSLLDVTEFKVNFPNYRESYLVKSLPILKKIMKEHGIEVELDTKRGSLGVKTTGETWDPYAIMLARDTIKLISRHVDLERAIKVFEEGTTSEIIDIKKLCHDDVFIKRRDNLIGGKEKKTLIGIQTLTKCELFIQGGTVAIIGPYKGVLQAMKIVKGCMEKNILPIISLTDLYKKVKLAKDPEMKDKNWEKQLPSESNKSLSKRKKKKTERVEKEYNPFPPAQMESKLDNQINEGEFFINKVFKKGAFDKEEQKKISQKRQLEKRAVQYIAPEEPPAKKKKEESTKVKEVDVEKLKKKLKKHKKKEKAA